MEHQKQKHHGRCILKQKRYALPYTEAAFQYAQNTAYRRNTKSISQTGKNTTAGAESS